jgi:hypothetical protein
MTPNGAAAFAIVMVVSAMIAGPRGLAILYAAAAAFALVEVGPHWRIAARRAGLIMLPLAVFMLLVWVAFVGRAPDEIAAQVPGTRAAALAYVTTVCARLFVIVLVLQLATLCFDKETPLAVIRGLRAPFAVKRLLVLTLSLIETLRHAVDRSYTALIASGIVTRGLSLRNFRNGWILLQSIWLTTITAVTGRLRDKWPVEDTLGLLRPAIAAGDERVSFRDLSWLAVALAVGFMAPLAGWYGAP